MRRIVGYRGDALLIAGFVLAALNLRPALAGVSPVLPAIMRDLGLSPAGGGAVTTVMVGCLGLLAPVAPVLATRIGLDRTLLAGLLVLAAGVALRSADGVSALYGGAALAGAAIAVMNVVMPGLVKRHFPSRIGLFTGLYVSVMVGGAAAASAVMVPLTERLGWRTAVGTVAPLALLASALWAVVAVRPGAGAARRTPGSRAGGRPYLALLRARATWLVAAFMGMQSLTFYVMLAWLPTIFQEAGLPAGQAGYLLGLTNLVQIPAALLVPLHAGRARSQVPHVVAAMLLVIAGYAGVLLAPTTAPWLWMVVLGLGQGAAIALALLVITVRAPDPASVTALSAVAQTGGYLLAALGPFAFGVLHEVSGGWTVPLLAGLGVCVVQLAAGVLAARPAPVWK
ncbi:MFS transporter [Microbispora sp. NBC_01389]|uniref:MFS transporter n=1 Tax=Microbispora sp. NBC_01389 TaxID=2903584 RepID=UPI0032508D43